ncbi:MAG: hypothetical protein M1819_004440 [Sarea resinae]|nr:MAG: hypothetical protein M1819_004440 [Sarea resinae]
MSAERLGRHRSVSQGSKTSKNSGSSMPQITVVPEEDEFRNLAQPCAATASFLLFAQGPTIVCLHHDTLAIERRFQQHSDDVAFISVDTTSERGAGRLVVSYDVGQTAIFWDIYTGEEMARFASYEQIRAASWMKNGIVALGNSHGEVILFDPSNSEHVSVRTIFDPITAISPSGDGRSFALGYMNGTILIANLQPTFTILQTLSTARAPSPIVTLAWHASSSKQTSEMLATQTMDGDLRVWAISKPASADPPRVIRVLKRTDNNQPGPNWLAWSKNGRLVQFSEGETWSWDVRTKHVACEPVPTFDDVQGIANFGPTATLFTLRSDNTVQQFELSPPSMVANVKIDPVAPLRDSRTNRQEQKAYIGARLMQQRARRNEPEVEEEAGGLTPLERIAAREVEHSQKKRTPSPATLNQGAASSTGSRSEASHRHGQSVSSAASRRTGKSNSTKFSYGSSYHSTAVDSVSMASSSTASKSSRPSQEPSRLRNEFVPSPLSPEKEVELFSYTKARIGDLEFKNPPQYMGSRQTPDDLRRQMLSLVFGWDGDIRELIRDEMAHHTSGSSSAILLAKWLGDEHEDIMASMVGSASMTSSDWMLLALSQLGGHSSTKKVGQTFVQRLLEKGEVHAAAAILIGLGDQHDAVEVYVTRNFFLEAVLLTCLLFPTDWQRQSHLVKKWGEYAIADSQHQLAIRCFTCTTDEPSVPWTSPNAQQATFFGIHEQSHYDVLSPPLSPPDQKPGMPNRLTAKNASLKLITQFDGKKPESRAKGRKLDGDDRTPVNMPGVTPIADTAIESITSNAPWLRLPHGSANPSSARTMTPGGFQRNRLPSIGETPADATPNANPRTGALPTPVDSGSDKERELRSNEDTKSGKGSEEPVLLLSSATYQPSTAKSRAPVFDDGRLPSPGPAAITALRNDHRQRNGSRDRMPDGLSLDPNMMVTVDYGLPSADTPSDVHARRNSNAMSQNSSALSRSETRSPLGTGSSYNFRSPMTTGRSIDNYIDSLDEANYQFQMHHPESLRRPESRDSRRPTDPDTISIGKSASRNRPREESRGRSERSGYIRPAKRSPSSPVPMSPEDIQRYSQPSGADKGEDPIVRPSSRVSQKDNRGRGTLSGESGGRALSKVSDMSRRTVRKGTSKQSSRATSRRRSPDVGLVPNTGRGRSHSRNNTPGLRSPSSPLPMSAQAQLYREDDDKSAGEDSEDERNWAKQNRLQSRHRSRSRQTNGRGTSARRGHSNERSTKSRNRSRRREVANDSLKEEKIESYSQVRKKKSDRTLKKELAAQELADRRKSLARRPSAPAIPLPGEWSSNKPSNHNRSVTDLASGSGYNEWNDPIARSQTVSAEAMMGSNTRSHPATPRAMRHPGYNSDDAPAVPGIPSDIVVLPPPIDEQPERENGYPRQSPQSSYVTRDVISRSISAPIPEPLAPRRGQNVRDVREDLPVHPAYIPGLPSSSRRRADSQAGRRPSRDDGQQRAQGSYGMSQQPQQSGYANNEPSSQPRFINGIEIIEERPTSPPVLAELQHLSMQVPPPPPPPPAPPAPDHLSRTNSTGHANTNTNSTGGIGVISIAIDDQPPSASTTPIFPPPAEDQQYRSSPLSHRRGFSAQEPSNNSNNFGSKFRTMTDQFRTSSRNRNRSASQNRSSATRSPPVPYDSMHMGLPGGGMLEQVIPPSPSQQQLQMQQQQYPQQVSSPVSSVQYPHDGAAEVRNPKDIRAAMMRAGMI